MSGFNVQNLTRIEDIALNSATLSVKAKLTELNITEDNSNDIIARLMSGYGGLENLIRSRDIASLEAIKKCGTKDDQSILQSLMFYGATTALNIFSENQLKNIEKTQR